MAATMAAAVFDGRLRHVTDHPVPERKPGWALIRVHTAGICGTDMEVMRGYLGFRGVLGHEFIGVVEESDDPVWTGRRVGGEINAACGRCENVNMGFSSDRRTIGTKWGQAPVRIEAVRGTLKLPGSGWRCQALDAIGKPAKEIASRAAGDTTEFRLAPESASLWYLFTR